MEIEKLISLSPNYIVNTDFYNSIKDLVTCSICLNVLIDPLSCNKCETSYCKNCLSQWKPSQSLQSLSCPMKCVKPKFNEPNRVLKNILEKLEFTCEYACLNKKIFSYDQILIHLLNDCENVRIDCSICSSKVRYKEYKNSTYYRTLIKLNSDLTREKEQNAKLLQTIEKLNSEIGRLRSEIINREEVSLKDLSINTNKHKSNNEDLNIISNGRNPGKSAYSHSKSLNKDSKKKADVITIHNNEYDLFDKCPHFKGNYIPIFNCCEKSYPCYMCHQEATNHNIEISNKVICLYCKNIYTGNQCDTCGAFQLYKKK